MLPGSAAAVSSFYTPPSTLPSGRDGDVIRSEAAPVQLALGGLLLKAQRIMYLSRDARGQRIAVTGIVLTPSLPWAGPGQRPLIGYAAGTQGMGDDCAPSWQLQSGIEYETPNIVELVLRGWAVVLTDYEGLGTPGVHSYLDRTAEAHAVLDSIRAAQRLPAANVPDHGPVGVMGFSQGGGAAAATAELQPEYAPELNVKGVYAGGVPADMVSLMQKVDGTWAAGLESYFMDALDAFHPELHVADLLNDKGRELGAQVATECTIPTAARHLLTRTDTLTKDGRSFAAHLAEPPFKAVMDDLRIGSRTPSAPVLVLQSPGDELVPYQPAVEMARSWCSRGSKVRFENLLAPEHGVELLEGNVKAGLWMADRFAGKPATSNCNSL
jgi:pimeloyl-ACP methyl ester carboxylesterase